MDYEQKYNEALGWMRQLYPCLYGQFREDAERFFPELKESGDEWFIKELQGFLESYGADYFGTDEWQKFYAWLENQKEPIDPFDTKLFQDGVKEGRRLEREDIKKEQKPVHTAKEMWKEMRLEVYAQASGNRHEPNYSDDSTKMFSLCDIDEIFEKIGNSTVGSQPAEWSEEDDKIRRNLMSLFANMRGDRITEETYQKYYPWLKDLRPSWKPSEGQPQVAGVGKMEPEVDLEKASRNVYESWMGGTMVDFLRDMVELGKALKARKEE